MEPFPGSWDPPTGKTNRLADSITTQQRDGDEEHYFNRCLVNKSRWKRYMKISIKNIPMDFL